MTHIMIEDNTPEGKWLLELIRGHKSVTVMDEKKKKGFREAVAECNGRPAAEFFDEMSRQAKDISTMREVIVSEHLWGKIKEVNDYLINELHLSEEATEKRIRRMEQFVMDFAKRVDHPLCRFKKWRTLGYHCAVFEKDWVFAYEVFDEGVIVRDMANTALLAE